MYIINDSQEKNDPLLYDNIINVVYNHL